VTKALAAIDMGTLFTDNPWLAKAARMWRTFGEDEREPVGDYGTGSHWSEYTGVNARPLPGSAALVQSQLPLVAGWLEVAQRNGQMLTRGLEVLPGIQPPVIAPGAETNYHLFRICVVAEALGWEGPVEELLARIMWALHCEGVPVGHWMPFSPAEMPGNRREEAVFWRPGLRLDLDRLPPLEPHEFPVARGLRKRSFVLGKRIALQVQNETLMQQIIDAFTKVIVEGAINSKTLFEMDYRAMEFRPVPGVAL
jgi:dTDP-4-amino-4,6-dideoxygalactose transaminase